MNLAQLKDEVGILSGRPDLTDRIASAVRASTLKMHHLEFFSKDIVEQGIQFESAAYRQSFDYKVLFPDWRSLSYLRKVASGSLEPLDPPLKVLTPGQILDSYSVEKEDVVYEAGQVLQIRTYAQYQYFIVGYYKHPDITDGTYTSWIAEDYPYAIIFDAVSTVFGAIGHQDQQREFMQKTAEQIRMLTNSNLLAEGY